MKPLPTKISNKRVIASKCLLLVLLFSAPNCLFAQDTNQLGLPPQADTSSLKEGVMPVKVVDGHLVVFADLFANGAAEEFALLVDFQAEYELSLVRNAAKRLKLGGGSGPINVVFPGGYKREVSAGDVQQYAGPMKPDDITKYHIGEMDERKIAGAIGAEFFSKYRVTIDLNGKQIQFEKPKAVNKLEELKGDFVVSPIRQKWGTTFFPITLPDKTEAEMVLGTNVHDTFISRGVANRFKKPAGNIGSVFFKTEVERAKVDLAKYVAFRPGSIDKMSSSTVSVTGTHLLKHFRITLDWQNKYAVFTQTKSAKFPQQDLAFFEAEYIENSKVLLGYLKKYPKERLSKLAAKMAVDCLIDEEADHSKIYDAVEMVVDLTEAQRRSVTCLDYFEPLKEIPKSIKLLQKVGDLGLKHSNKAIDGFTAYDIHVQLGLLSQENGELKRAWEHLLSATFGRPDDFRAVVALGKVYEKQGRFRRAYSRYKKVANYVPLPNPNDEFLPPEVLQDCISQAKQGMKRLSDKVPEKDK